MKTTIQTLLLFVFLSAAAEEENQNYYLNNTIEDLVAPTENPSMNRNIASEERLKQISSGVRKYLNTPNPYSPTIGDVVNRGMANYSDNTYNNITYDDVRALREDQNENEQDYTYETKNKYRWAWLLGVVGFLFVIIGIAMRYKK